MGKFHEYWRVNWWRRAIRTRSDRKRQSVSGPSARFAQPCLCRTVGGAFQLDLCYKVEQGVGAGPCVLQIPPAQFGDLYFTTLRICWRYFRHRRHLHKVTFTLGLRFEELWPTIKEFSWNYFYAIDLLLANFDVLLTVHLSTFILVINQLDAQNLFYNKFISCLYMFRAHVLIVRRSKLYYTASGIVTLKQVSGLKLLK